ncbi:hypothetical protein BREVNS_0948 [Brevinematales bacterium NS]|nr:hypothetical protein BREVNS_0948 [Brevinematales bacterium NS]
MRHNLLCWGEFSFQPKSFSETFFFFVFFPMEKDKNLLY